MPGRPPAAAAALSESSSICLRDYPAAHPAAAAATFGLPCGHAFSAPAASESTRARGPPGRGAPPSALTPQSQSPPRPNCRRDIPAGRRQGNYRPLPLHSRGRRADRPHRQALTNQYPVIDPAGGPGGPGSAQPSGVWGPRPGRARARAIAARV
jgi:hypothetical protein